MTETVTTPAGRFALEQRLAGFVDNDGRWTVSRYPELSWSTIGTLHRTSAGEFLGVFDTREQAEQAISAAPAGARVNEAVL